MSTGNADFQTVVRPENDSARQIFTILMAVFQIVAGLVVPIGEIAGQTPSFIDPAAYAFAIWGVIYLLALAYAVYQLLPAHREDLLLRRAGWYIAGAFLCNGLWEAVFIPARLFTLAMICIIAILVFAGTAYLKILSVSREQQLTLIERWLVALPVGLLFGWITAANFVSFLSLLVSFHIISGLAEAILAVLLLLVCGGGAARIVLWGRDGNSVCYLAYAGAVIWGCIAIAINQLSRSPLTALAALVAGIPIVVAVLFVHSQSRRSINDPNI